MSSHRLCKIKDVPVGNLNAFNVNNKEILVANVNGRFYCLDGRCPHAGAPLKEGVLSGGRLQCPWHDATFDIVSGAALNGPPRRPLRVYSCTIKNEYLYVELPPAKSPSTS
jgi:nitrite reductase/ring-hydroxylating ferredoxin subunit